MNDWFHKKEISTICWWKVLISKVWSVVVNLLDIVLCICRLRKSKRVPEKHLLLLNWLCQSLWLRGSQQTVENSLRDGNTRLPDLPPEKSVSGQEATVRTGHGITDWLQIGKGVCQGCVLSACLFNLYTEYIMRDYFKERIFIQKEEKEKSK